MAKKFAEHNGLNLTQTNNDVLAAWEKNDIFHKSIDEREGCPQFIFFEGPPSANGHPGIHHVLARSIKDTFNRYKTMKGFQVHRKAGWDTHGLPVELGVEKELGITKKDIDNKASEKYISTEDYNHKCRENVMKFTAEWRELTEKMGYFVDLDHPYITYDNKYIETLCGSSSSSTTRDCSIRATPFSRTRQALVQVCRRTSSTSLAAIAT